MKFFPVIAALILVLLIPQAPGHVPVTAGDNENMSSATYLPDIAKSWAIYGYLQGRPQYISFDAEMGQIIYASLLIPTDPKLENFKPEMALIVPGGPASIQDISRPELQTLQVQVPENYSTVLVPSSRPASATYEAFGPSSFYELSEINITAPQSGRYYLVVLGNDSGSYGVALGYLEEFTFWERITTPLRLISVYLWEGQSLFLVLAPVILAVLAGLFLIRRSPRKTLYCTLGTMAGALFLGWSATVLSQIAYNLTRTAYTQEVFISLALAALPAVFGVIAIRLSRGEAGLLQRLILAIMGTITLISGSGLIIGPLLALASSIMPSRK